MQDRGRDVGIDRRKGSRSKSNGSFDICRDFVGYRIFLFFALAFFCLRGFPLRFLLPPQPRGMRFVEFLVISE